MRKLAIVVATLSLALVAGCGPSGKPADANKPLANADKSAPENKPEQPGPTEVEKPGQWKYQQNLDDAVRWILDNQKKKGDWGYMSERPNDIYLGSINSLHVFGNASTALCVMGLMAQPETEEIATAIGKGLEYLITAPDTPRATMDTFYNVWSHAYMVQCLCTAIQDGRYEKLKVRLQKRAELELGRLLDHQSLDGGWGYYDFSQRTKRPSGEISTSFTTAAALVAMHYARAVDLPLRDHNVQIGLDYLERNRVPNGAYFYSTGHKYSPMWDPNLPRGSLGRSQGGDNALFTWDRTITQDTLKAQLDNFFKDHVFIEIGRGRQFPHEAWYATAPYYYYFGHYYASRNVLALKEDIRAEYSNKLAEFVVAGQYDDGSFWDYPLYGYTKPYGTGYGAMILSNLKRAAVTNP
ncbi:MAG: hypothetical protein KDB68_16435 [Planctomycetes bacterium]|nr:hypothetical protein [Planctomycetota bacterium]